MRGSRPGERRGGRQKGTPNKRTAALQERVQEAASVLESALPDAFKGDAHTFLMSVYKDSGQPLPVRVDAAKAAIGYEKPKLGSVQHSGDAGNPVTFTITTGVPRDDHEGLNGHRAANGFDA